MTYNTDIHITTIEEVRTFFHHLAFDRNLSFHPDDSFSDYTNNKTGELSFSVAEALLYDRLMSECFSVCDTHGQDIYELGLNTMRERMGILRK